MILNGFYFLIAALFIPNIETLAQVQMSSLSINSTVSMLFMIMTAAGVFLVGVYLTKESITSLNDIYQRKPSNKIKKN
jgi:predicted transporter